MYKQSHFSVEVVVVLMQMAYSLSQFCKLSSKTFIDCEYHHAQTYVRIPSDPSLTEIDYLEAESVEQENLIAKLMIQGHYYHTTCSLWLQHDSLVLYLILSQKLVSCFYLVLIFDL